MAALFFFVGVLVASLVVGTASVFTEAAERRRRVEAARWRHRRAVVVHRWPDCGFGPL